MSFSSNLHFEIVPNQEQHTGDTCCAVEPYRRAMCSLAIVEFDDQGLCFDRQRFDQLITELKSLEKEFPIILVFAHGWRHNASADDCNLRKFREVLAKTACEQATLAERSRPVLGVFLAWRGLSTHGNDAWEYLSFWDRMQAAERVAHGSARELLGRLKAFRNGPLPIDGDPKATLIIIGHSFGGLIVYTAIAQSLIEAAATPDVVVPSFGDLVLLVNPAFSAVSYLPIYSILWSGKKFDQKQPPVFVSVTAENDTATKDAFPAANLRLHVEEATRGRKESQALTRTMGHLDWLQTHELSASSTVAAAATQSPHVLDQVSELSNTGAEQQFGSVVVNRLSPKSDQDPDARIGTPDSPFWVARAKPEVVDGHNGIWTDPFQSFVHALVVAHLEKAAPAPQLPIVDPRR